MWLGNFNSIPSTRNKPGASLPPPPVDCLIILENSTDSILLEDLTTDLKLETCPSFNLLAQNNDNLISQNNDQLIQQ